MFPYTLATPLGVIFVTLFEPQFATYMLSPLSIVIPSGFAPVVAKTEATHAGVIFVTLFEP